MNDGQAITLMGVLPAFLGVASKIFAEAGRVSVTHAIGGAAECCINILLCMLDSPCASLLLPTSRSQHQIYITTKRFYRRDSNASGATYTAHSAGLSDHVLVLAAAFLRANLRPTAGV